MNQDVPFSRQGAFPKAAVAIDGVGVQPGWAIDFLAGRGAMIGAGASGRRTSPSGPLQVTPLRRHLKPKGPAIPRVTFAEASRLLHKPEKPFGAGALHPARSTRQAP